MHEIIQLPVAHGEGKFIPKDKKILDELNKEANALLESVKRVR